MFDNKIIIRNMGQLVQHCCARVQERGIFYLIRMGVKIFFYLPISWLIYRLWKRMDFFEFAGNSYRYDLSWYNMSWLNERTIEISIAKRIMAEKTAGTNILEVGNVLHHYGINDHTVVDLYEKGPGVINCDIIDYETKVQFDLIITISTLEHIGWDDVPREPQKVLIAIDKLKALLKYNGMLFFTVPLGINEFLDNIIIDNQISTSSGYVFKRKRFLNRWVELKDVSLGEEYPNIVGTHGEYLYIGFIAGGNGNENSAPN